MDHTLDIESLIGGLESSKLMLIFLPSSDRGPRGDARELGHPWRPGPPRCRASCILAAETSHNGALQTDARRRPLSARLALIEDCGSGLTPARTARAAAKTIWWI